MANAVEKSCTMLVHSDRQSSASEIKEALEGSDTESKIVAMQKAVTMLLNGEQLPQLFITIVRYVLPSEDHTVQKLQQYQHQYTHHLVTLALGPDLQEAIEKTDSAGKVLPEMVSRACLTCT